MRCRSLPLIAALLMDLNAAPRTAGSASPLVSRRLSAPSILIFTGRMLRGRIVLSDPESNVRLFSATVPVSSSDMTRLDSLLSRREYLDVWMFWGPGFLLLPRDSTSLARLTLADANQRGPFYLGRDTLAPALELRDRRGTPVSTRVLQAEAIDILRRAGVPTMEPRRHR